MSTLITILIAGIFTNNLLASKLLGIENATEKVTPRALLNKCGVLSALLFLSSLATYPIVKYLLTPFGADYLSPLVSVIIICAISFLAFSLSKKYAESVYLFLKEHSSVLSCSTVVLGLCLNISYNEITTNFIAAVVYVIASAMGFTLVSFMFYAINKQIEETSLPLCMKGLPITLLIASFIALAFGGFSGI